MREAREVTETRPGVISQGSCSQEGYSRQEGGMETDGEVAMSGCYRTSIPIRTAGLYVRGKDRVKVFLAIIWLTQVPGVAVEKAANQRAPERQLQPQVSQLYYCPSYGSPISSRNIL